jgi:minor extracellular serine protease Vpr
MRRPPAPPPCWWPTTWPARPADRGVLKSSSNGATLVTNVNVVGAGRENLLSAVNAKVTLDPVSLSFGAVPSGSGQSRNLGVTLTNVSGAAQTYSLAISGAPSDVSFGLDQSSLTLAAGASATVTVTMTASRGAAAGGRQAILEVGAGAAGNVAHAALFTLVK